MQLEKNRTGIGREVKCNVKKSVVRGGKVNRS
jgi:hypothetical protein